MILAACLGLALAAAWAALLWAFPLAVCRGLGAVLAFLVGTVFRARRDHVESAMQRAGVPAPKECASAMYASLGRGLFELAATFALPRRLLATVRLPDLSQLAPRGGIVAVAHTGNWDLLACAVAAKRPLTVVTKHFSIGAFDRLWQGVRRARGVRLVGERGAARAVLSAVGRGELAAMLIDQVPERTRAVMKAPFLGAEAYVDLSPALLAMRARCPLLLAFPRREADGTHGVEIAAVLHPPAAASREWAAAAMREATRHLEAFVLREPEQWLWLHRRWREPKAPSPAVLPESTAGGIRPA